MSFLTRLHNALEGRERMLAGVISVLVVLACWAVIFRAGDTIKSADEKDFFAIAENLALYGVFAVDPAQPTAYRAPGLPFFLAPLAWLGTGLMEMRLVNAVLVGIGLMLLFDLIRKHASPMAGLVAVAMVPCWPVVIYSASTIYPQTLAAFLLVLLLWSIERVHDNRGLWSALWAGLVYGALVLTVPIVLLLTPIIGLWFLMRAQRPVIQGVVFAVVSALLVCSWTARNYVVFDAFVPVATSSGFNLLAGNTAEARWNTSLNVRFPEQVYTDLTGKSEVERDDIMTAAAIAEIKADPARFATLYAGKFLHWFHFSNRLLSDEVIEGGASAVPVGARDVILFVSYVLVIAGPLVVRLVMIRRVPMRAIEVLFLLLWIAAGLAYALYFTRVRFRLPFDWLLIAGNAIFLATLFQYHVDHLRSRSGTRKAVSS